MSINNRAVVASVLAGAVLVGGAGAAAAKNTGWKSLVQTNGGKTASFTGARLFYSNTDHHGAFEVRGTLRDLKDNNRSVKFQVKVEGYSPNVWDAPEDANMKVPATLLWDPEMTIVPYVAVQTCQRNILADDCSAWRRYNNPYYKG